MKKLIKTRGCEECEQEEHSLGGQSLKAKVWQAQLENFREIIINEDITSDLTEKVTIQILNINRYDDTMEQQVVDYVREPITLMISSNGGDIFEALSICSAMEMSRTPIHTVALGKAFSAGFLILICGDTRFAQHHSTLMYHTGSSGYIGVITDVLEHGDFLEKLNERIHKIVIDHTDITDDQLMDVFMRKSDWYMDVNEALELGVIDCIWGVPMDVMYPDAGEDEGCPSECDEDCAECPERVNE